MAAVGTGLADAAPTGTAGVDVVLGAATGAVVTLACSAARRWTWPVVAGAAVVIAGSLAAMLVGALALGFAMDAAIRSTRRDRVVGAVVGGLAVQALIRGGEVWFHGFTALVGVVVCAGACTSAYRTLGRRSRRRVRQVVYLVSSVVIAGVAGLVVSVIAAKADIDDGVARSRAGLEAARKGDQSIAKSQWETAGQSFASAEETLDNPWLKIAYAVPVVSQHARAISDTAHSGTRIASSAAVAAGVAPYRSLRSSSGRVDVALIEQMQAPVAATTAALRDARTTSRTMDTDWLVGPLRTVLADFADDLDEAIPEAERADAALAVAPELLGGNGLRRYLVLFGTPSESRGLGGFIGSWAELTVDDGEFVLARHGKISELNEATPFADRRITDEPEYLARYAHLQPARFIQNISASPDFPTVARVAAQLLPQTGGDAIDGTIYVDPEALAAFLELTGPVTAEGIPEPLTADNAADYLLHGQYLEFPDTDERSDLLGNASEATFEALTTRELPSIADIAEVLSPMVHQKRLLFTTANAEADAFLADIGLTGAFPEPDGHDFLSVRTTNGSGNKIDYYLRRSVDYQARFDPTTGRTAATVTIELTNLAPTEGEPAYVLGNQDTWADRTDGRPFGSNTVAYSVYTPLQPVRSTVDDVLSGVQVESELGYTVASGVVTVASGDTATVVIELEGNLDPSLGYQLTIDAQPLVAPDAMRASVRPLTSESTVSASGVAADGTWSWTGPLVRSREVRVAFSPTAR